MAGYNGDARAEANQSFAYVGKSALNTCPP